ncbi:MAG: hypothetical protein GY755_14135 [Chloroflexi bacterium]|nr:hypothetical protein [Chloroflexota bacterium]
MLFDGEAIPIYSGDCRVRLKPVFEQERSVRRTFFDKKMLIDKCFACRRADSHRFGATHTRLSESPT